MLKIALRREKMGESAPFWRFSAATYPDLSVSIPSKSLLSTGVKVIDQNSQESSGVRHYKSHVMYTFSCITCAFVSSELQ
jgi:acetolactate synthase I/III small subunit